MFPICKKVMYFVLWFCNTDYKIYKSTLEALQYSITLKVSNSSYIKF
jgi:hypothetical protein